MLVTVGFDGEVVEWRPDVTGDADAMRDEERAVKEREQSLINKGLIPSPEQRRASGMRMCANLQSGYRLLDNDNRNAREQRMTNRIDMLEGW